MTMTPTEFYDDLMAELDAKRSALGDDDGATFFTRPMSEPELIEWLSFQAWYELNAAKFIGGWLADTPERDALVLLAQQVEDEGLHYEYCMRALERRGVTSLDNWKPEPEWEAWVTEWYPSGDDTLERVAAHNVTGELGACQAFFDLKPRLPDDVVKTLERIIPDEQFHMKIGRQLIERYALTDDAQERVRARAMKTFELEQAGRIAYNRRMSQLGLGDVDDPSPLI
ncbi:MAG: ferritin-like domain-containing protein [Acidimicrobiales bacterium]